MGKLSIRLFGRLKVLDGAGGEVGLSGRKPRALLAYLALNAGRPQPRDKLAALLWGDRFDEQARQSLRQCISKLRKTLGDAGPGVLLTDGDDVGLNADATDIDAGDFVCLAAEGTPEAETRADNLKELVTSAEDFHVDNFSLPELEEGELQRSEFELYLDQVALIADLDHYDARRTG